MPERLRQRLRNFVLIYFAAAWGTSWAAMELAGPNLLALPWAQAGVGVIVSWIGGFAASLGRMVTATYERKPFHTGREFARDGAVSTVIGLSGYWGGMTQEIGPASLAMVLLLAGYAGTRTLATWVDRVIHPKNDERE
jgi:hypothetical protein